MKVLQKVDSVEENQTDALLKELNKYTSEDIRKALSIIKSETAQKKYWFKGVKQYTFYWGEHLAFPVGTYIQDYIIAYGMSIDKLANYSGISDKELRGIIIGERLLDKDTSKKLTKACSDKLLDYKYEVLLNWQKTYFKDLISISKLYEKNNDIELLYDKSNSEVNRLGKSFPEDKITVINNILTRQLATVKDIVFND